MKKSLRILPTLLILLSLASTAFPQPGRWAEPVNISNTQYTSSEPDMAIGLDNKIHVVWEDYSRTGIPEISDVLYSCFNGFSWSEPIQISGMDSIDTSGPKISVDSNGNPHVVWNFNVFYPPDDILYSTLTDTGWTTPISIALAYTYNSQTPDIIVDHNDYVHILWGGVYGGDYQILHRYYDGNEWSGLIQVTQDTVNNGNVQLAIDGQNNIHAVWKADSFTWSMGEIFYCKFTNGHWGIPENLSQCPDSTSKYPSIAIDQNDFPHVVWSQRFTSQIYEIWYEYYNGVNWSPPQTLSDLGFRAERTSISINQNNDISVLFGAYEHDPIHPTDSYVYYTFYFNSQWTTPDSIFSEYSCSKVTSSFDQGNRLHVCIPIGFNTYSDIGYTYFEYENSVEGKVDGLVDNIGLDCYPNPANNAVYIRLELDSYSDNDLSVYNIAGQLVKNFSLNALYPSLNIIRWDCRNDNGIDVNSGVYFIIINELIICI